MTMRNADFDPLDYIVKEHEHDQRKGPSISASLFTTSVDTSEACSKIHRWRILRILTTYLGITFFIVTFAMIVAKLFESRNAHPTLTKKEIVEDEDDDDSEEGYEYFFNRIGAVLRLDYAYKKSSESGRPKDDALKIAAVQTSDINFFFLLNSCLVVFPIAYNMRCTQVKLPDSNLGLFLFSLKIKCWRFSFGVASSLLLLLFMKLFSRLLLNNQTVDTIGKGNQVEEIFSYCPTGFVVPFSFLSGYYFFGYLLDSDKLLIQFTTVPIDYQAESWLWLCTSWFKTSTFISIILKSTPGAAIFMWIFNEVFTANAIALTAMFSAYVGTWILINIAVEVSQYYLSEEIGLPVSRDLYPFKPIHGRDLMLSNGMCITKDEDEYLKFLSLYEFYCVATSTAKSKALYTSDRHEPTGFERTLDATFFIVDNFITSLKNWMLSEGFSPEPTKPQTATIFDPNKQESSKREVLKIGDQFYGIATTAEQAEINNMQPSKEEAERSLLRTKFHSKMRNLAPTGTGCQTSSQSSPYVNDLSISLLAQLIIIKLMETLTRVWTSLSSFCTDYWMPIKAYLIKNCRIARWIFAYEDPYYCLADLMRKDFQIVNWALRGAVEMTCKSSENNGHFLLEEYLADIFQCLLDFHDILLLTCHVFEKRSEELYDSGMASRENPSIEKNYCDLKALCVSCEFGVSKLKETFKNQDYAPHFPQELQTKLRKFLVYS